MQNQAGWEWQQQLLDREREKCAQSGSSEYERLYLESIKASDNGSTFDDAIRDALKADGVIYE